MEATTTTTPAFDLRRLIQSNDTVMAVGVILVILMMLIPLPAVMIDILVAFNLALSVGILLIALYVRSPMEFSVFPTLLLLVTVLRLGVNIAASRAILLEAEGGKVIATFGDIVLGGNYVVGVVVFLMLLIIQFVVITKGSSRVAEVSARFTLDAMPGKQLAIDADLNAGLIDEQQARRRRGEIENEADFYGAMDGASKFVQGDTIAGVIVVVVNILGGFVIGMLMHSMDAMQALQTYTILTVGAGIAIQIPSLLVSTASGLIVTRSGSDGSVGNNMLEQLSNLNALLAVAAVVMAMALIPGMPKLPFLGLGLMFSAAGYFAWRAEQTEELPDVESAPVEAPEDMYSMLMVDPLELEIGYGLIPLVSEDRADNLLRRVKGIRRQVATDLGLVLPIVRIRDNLRLTPNSYSIKLRGEEISCGEIIMDRLLAIPGSDADESLKGMPTKEPAFGLPALWIRQGDKGRAELAGYTVVDPLSVLATHLTEVIRKNAPELLGRQDVQEMLDRVKQESPAVVEGLVPDVLTLSEVQAVLRNLLQERIPIRDLGGILEVLVNTGGVTHDPVILAEAVRQSLARTITNQYRDAGGSLRVATLSPDVENLLKQSLGTVDGSLGFQLDSPTAERLIASTAASMESMARGGSQPVLLCPRELRVAFRRLIERTLPHLAVLAFSEVSKGTKVQAVGMIELR